MEGVSTMAGEKPETDPFLTALEVKIAALQQLRESYIAAASVGAIGPVSGLEIGNVVVSGGGSAAGTSSTVGVGASTGPIELPTGVFRDKGLADAIRMYLSIAKRKQTQKEIKAALMEGGLATTAEFFDATLAGTLHRMKRKGELLQFKDGWDLAESYPESFRQRMAQSSDPPKRRRKRKAVKRADKGQAQKAAPTKPEKAATEQPTLRVVS